MSEIRDALRTVRDREPVELGESVTPDRVVKLALDVLDLGYRAHGENARASLPAVQIDWMMQRWADAEERAATADHDASDFATAMDARMDDAVEMAKLTAERDAAEARFTRLLVAFHDATRRPLGVTPDSGAEFYDHRLAEEAEARRPGIATTAEVDRAMLADLEEALGVKGAAAVFQKALALAKEAVAARTSSPTTGGAA